MTTNKKMLITIIIITIVVAIPTVVLAGIRIPVMGAKAKGARLERMQKAANYYDGQFHNQVPGVTLMSDSSTSAFKSMWNFLFNKPEGLKPPDPLNMVKRDLKNLPADKDIYVWFGHSAYLLSLHGTTFLIDPTLLSGSPVFFANKPFKGTNAYKPDDLPYIDYLIISHDHYDHLDYKTVKRIKDKVGHVVCGLGVGAHFERWGYDASKIIEMNWYESCDSIADVRIDCLPACHFSGRTFRQNDTLWASYMIQAAGKTIYISGDSGYGPHFKEIGEKYAHIDLAILENGQYNEKWSQIHTMPEYLGVECLELGADKIITVHHSKFALALHSWDEPLRNEEKLREEGLNVLDISLGEITYL